MEPRLVKKGNLQNAIGIPSSGGATVIPTFVIFLREGIEASMIIAILLAYLESIDQRRHFKDICLGVAAAFVLILAGGIAAYLLISQYSGSRVQTIFETITYLIAATSLTYMTFWMQRHSRTLSKELKQRSDNALDNGTRTGLSLVAFSAVGREGLETMVFTLAIVFASSKQAPTADNSRWLLIGAIAGLVVALGIAFGIYKMGAKFNIGRFFRILGVLLLVFAAGLLSNAVANLQELGWLPFGTQTLWDSSNVLAQSSVGGDLLHSFFGYADHPTVLQAAVWLVFLSFSLVAYIVIGKSKPPRKSDAAVAPNASESLKVASN